MAAAFLFEEAKWTYFFDSEFRRLIPPLQPEEYSQLEASLKAEGNRDPVVIWKETRLMLDGHNRYNICQKRGIPLKPPMELSFPDRDAAKVWIIDTQLGRRNLAPALRIELALLKENIIRARAKENLVTSTGGANPQPLQNSANPAIDTREELAKAARVSHDTVWKYKQIRDKVTPEQKAKLSTGKATINQIYVAIKREGIRQSVKEAKWPEGKYRVIYADPPWKYSNNMPTDGSATGLYSEQQDHYPTMMPEAIAKLPVKDLALDNAVLFLWCTSPMLEQVFQIINAWGFKYKASFVWDKIKHNMGHYNSVRHEVLLVAVRGSCPPDIAKLYDSVQAIKRTAHSKKPARFRKIIETLYPYGPRLELFASEKVKGWEVFGNDIS